MLGVASFSAFLPKVKEILSNFLQNFTVPKAREHCMKMLDEYTDGGKQARGRLANSIFLELTGVDENSEEAVIGKTLGWALEIIQASYLIADDLMDQSKTRRGKECWYLHEGVGDQAVNDALILENIAFILIDTLKTRIPLKVLMQLIQALRTITTKTTMGQTYDFLAKDKKMSTYKKIVDHKTSYYSFHLPIILGMIGSQKFTFEEATKLTEEFSLAFGYLFQAQDDWIDVYGVPQITGKIGTDISDGKVTWLICKAYEIANEEQKQILDKSYGTSDIETVQKVYDEIDIKGKFKEFQQQQETLVQSLIDKFDKTRLPVKSFQALFDSNKNRKF